MVAYLVPMAFIFITGRRYNMTTGQLIGPKVPLEVFNVTQGKNYRFRLMSAAMTHPFKISIDSHLLHVIATDGHDVETMTVSSVVIQPGERYDVWIEATDPLHLGNYWIRAQTLEFVDKDNVSKTTKIVQVMYMDKI